MSQGSSQVVSPEQTSFNAGLLSPQMSARSKIDKYASGASVLDNFLPQVEGPLVRRPGTKYIAPQGDETAEARNIRFEFSVDQAYNLEFGDGYLRVFRDQALVLDSSHTAAIIDGVIAINPLTILCNTTSGLATGDMVFISGTNVPEINNQFFPITVVGGTNFELAGVDGTLFTPQVVIAGTVELVYSIVSPYTGEHVKEFHYAQSADVLYIADHHVPRHKLSRTADDAWVFTEIDGSEIDTEDDGLASWPPMASLNSELDRKLYAASDTTPGSTVTVTSTKVGTFVSADVGRFLMLKAGAPDMGYGKIDSVTDDQNVVVTVYSRYPNGQAVNNWPSSSNVLNVGNATAEWAFSAFDTVNGFPQAVTIFENRVWWAAPDSQVQGFWYSFAGSLENHRQYDADPTDVNLFAVTPQVGANYVLNSDRMDAIEWMHGLDVLFLGTRGGEWTVKGANIEENISQSNIDVKPRRRVGSRKDVLPVVIDAVVMFVQRAGRKIKELVFDDSTKSFQAPDMTQLSREVTFGRVKHMAFQQEPNKVLWVVLENGELVSFTYERDDDVTAWARQPLGGNGLAESVAVIPSQDEDEDEVWITVKRTINGQTRRSVEVVQRFWERGDDIEDALFLDAAVPYSGVAVSELFGMLHLIGEQVGVLTNGSGHRLMTVDARGRIDLDVSTTKAVSGLPYNSDFKSMRIESGSPSGVGAGKIGRIHQMVIRLDQTGPGLQYGTDFDEMELLETRDAEDEVNSPVVLFDGDTGSLAMPGGYGQEKQVTLRYDQPLPCSIIAYYPQLSTQD